MSIHFEEIPSDVEIPLQPPNETRTVLEEINARQELLAKRTIKCKDIKPFYDKYKKEPKRYTYKYFCVCPRYNPQYTCRHKDNVIIDRGILTKYEHIEYLATPKPNFGAPRKMPRFIQKKFIMPNCTARINRLASPDRKHVNDTLNKYQHIISKRHKRSLNKHLENRPTVEYTSIQNALDWLEEEKRLKKVAERVENLRCKKLANKIANKQRAQIKKIVFALFEEMKDFLLNDQFIIDESSTLVAVILEKLKEFTDKDFNITNNLREYQKILAFNLAVWINQFMSSHNIHVAEPPTQYPQMPQTQSERPTQEIASFLPVGDYISCSSLLEDAYDEYEDYSFQRTDDRKQATEDDK